MVKLLNLLLMIMSFSYSGILLCAEANYETKFVKDIHPGKFSSFSRNLTDFNGILFFSADDGVNGRELWRSDGTPVGSTMVKNIAPSSFSSFPRNLITINGLLFFTANNGIQGTELWVSDGTTTGTRLVRDILPGSGASNPDRLTAMNGKLFFTADDGVIGQELWISDGTTAGTMPVKDIQTGRSSSSPNQLIEVNGKLFFTAFNANYGTELWASDGTALGTNLVKDIDPGTTYSYSGEYRSFYNFNGVLYFSVKDDGAANAELWKSDGSLSGTVMVADINPGPDGSFPRNFAGIGNTLYFSAYTPDFGVELWKTDGTGAGTTLLRDINPGPDNGNPKSLRIVGTTLYFSTANGINGLNLWRSNGTSQGTKLVVEIDPGTINISNSSYFTNINETLLFTNTKRFSGTVSSSELWQSDGTAAGTRIVTDTTPGFDATRIENLTAVDQRLFFTAYGGNFGNELWMAELSQIKAIPNMTPILSYLLFE